GCLKLPRRPLLSIKKSVLLRTGSNIFVYMKLLLSLLCVTLWVFSALADFRAGIAIRNVTPDPLLPVVGGIGPGSKVTRKEGDITVRALVFEEGTNRVAIVSADFLGFPARLGDKVRAN